MTFAFHIFVLIYNLLNIIDYSSISLPGTPIALFLSTKPTGLCDTLGRRKEISTIMILPQNIAIEASTPITIFKAKRDQLLTQLSKKRTHSFLRDHAGLVDDYFLASFAQSTVGPQMGIMRNPYTLVALGGYGRAEQCVYSDIDLLFLFEKKVPPEAEALVREIVYPLWDIGLEVGHATRSIKECLKMARQDQEVLTSILDSRFICGMSPLYHQLMEQLRIKLIHIKPAQIVTWLTESNRVRHERFGDSAYLLEPNLKEGRGGLRDYHTMLWIAKIQSNIKQARDLEYFGYLSYDEYQELERSLDFIWHVRNRLHLLMKRKSDQLHLENQTKLAEAMNTKKTEGHWPVEVFMGRLHGHMEFVKQCYDIFIYELDQKKRMQRKNKALKETDVAGLKFNRGLLNFTSPEAILKNPELLIDIFVESSRQRAPLNVEARRLVKDFGRLIQHTGFRNCETVVRKFEKILTRPLGQFNVLSAMLDTGFLVNYIPQFKGVVNRIQFDQYHLYPVARHLLLTVRLLKNISTGADADTGSLCAKLYQEIRNKKPLLWAALLHDIGKAEPSSGHSDRGADMVGQILGEKGIAPNDCETTAFLVKEHLLLFENATRRDINDEETAIQVARRIGKADRLKMLYLLSVADAMATGPKAWNEWTASLLRSLFLKTLNVLDKGELVSRRATRTIEQKKERLLIAALNDKDREVLGQLIPVMSPRYLLYTASNDIPNHIHLFQALGDKEFTWQIEKSPTADTRTVTICAKDRPGLLSKIAGIFTLNNLNILDMRIFTWRNNIALDIFEVAAPPDLIFEAERWGKAARQLEAALNNELDLGDELATKKARFQSIQSRTRNRPQQVVVDNDSSSFFTIVEVTAWDFPGLLFNITNALFRCQLDIWVAKIANRVDQVVDVFYVRSFDGEKMDRPEQAAMIQKTVEAVLI
jgi:[protein-PII] uridylyltransferase